MTKLARVTPALVKDLRLTGVGPLFAVVAAPRALQFLAHTKGCTGRGYSVVWLSLGGNCGYWHCNS